MGSHSQANPGELPRAPHSLVRSCGKYPCGQNGGMGCQGRHEVWGVPGWVSKAEQLGSLRKGQQTRKDRPVPK